MHPVDSASEQTAQARNDLLSKRYATFAACTGFDLAQAFQDARLKAAGLPNSGKGHHFHEEYSDAEARGLIEWSAALLDPTGLRLQLKSQGYSPIPIRGKRPPMDEWQNLHVVTPEQIRNWAKDWSNAKSTGVLAKYTPAIDIDILDKTAVEAVEALAREHFAKHGTMLARVGKAPKRLIPFRTDEPFKKITLNVIAPDGKTGQKIEVLGEGQQFVAYGIHPDTKKPYQWFGGEIKNTKREELPRVRKSDLEKFIAEAEKVLAKHGYTPASKRPKKNDGNGAAGYFEQYAADHADDWQYLIDNIREGRELHDSTLTLAAKLITSGMAAGAVVNMLRAAMKSSEAPHDSRWQERYDDIPRLVSDAEGFRDTQTETSKGEAPTALMQSSAEFVADFVPPDYLIDGLLQRRYVYSMTAPTGSGKTAIGLRVAVHVAQGMKLAEKEVEKGRVLFFAGENPDDVRTRWIKLCEEMGLDANEMDVVFMPFTPNLSQAKIRKQIDTEATKHGPFSLLIVDTSASYYTGDDENDNVALGKHARMLRSFINLPGGPTILVTCHPTKTPNMENLLPRGGGAFLAEVDGNLVCIKDPATMVVEVTTHGKFRGPEFAPFGFKLVAGRSEKLVDTKGRPIWTVFARPISNEEQEAIEKIGRSDQDDLLRAMLDLPGCSLVDIAEDLNWQTMDGKPNKTKVHRVMMELKQAKLVEKQRDGHYILTKKGGEEAEETPEDRVKVVHNEPLPEEPFKILGKAPPGSRCALCGKGRPMKIKHGKEIDFWHEACGRGYLEKMAEKVESSTAKRKTIIPPLGKKGEPGSKPIRF